MRHSKKRLVASLAASAGLLAAVGGTGIMTAGTAGAATATVSATGFTNSFAAMTKLKSLAAAGKGNVAVILPDTVTSARYTEFDAPYLAKAFSVAGLPASKVTIQNAQGSDSTQLTDAQSAISAGASVLIVDPLDSGTGASIESYAKSHGVAVIDYDRLTLGGTRQYYVSFNNVKVGTLIGKGLVSCVASWKVAKPKVIEMVGAPSDNNATLFAQGYNAVLKPLFASKKWVKLAAPAGTWDPGTAETEFQQALTAHPSANAAVIPNDENGAPIITYLQNHGVKPKTFPLTGQDATLVGIQNVISGYQCGTVYKPIYEEAQAAAALALYIRAGKPAPSSLVNGKTTDTTAKVSVPSVLLPPEWVTPSTVESTVVADNFVPRHRSARASTLPTVRPTASSKQVSRHVSETTLS
jgi:D-xylose transport system substrate-binding protein